MARIILVRHGPSAHVHRDGPIDHTGVERWRERYDAASIRPDARPPAALLRETRAATHVLASDLPRAIASARLLAADRTISVSPLLRESELSIPRWPTRLPLGAWAVLIHLNWLYRSARGRDPGAEARARASAAAAWLGELVANDASALVITHGVFRQILRQQLLLHGWSAIGRQGGYRHWSTWTFVRDRTLAAGRAVTADERP